MVETIYVTGPSGLAEGDRFESFRAGSGEPLSGTVLWSRPEAPGLSRMAVELEAAD